MCVVGGLCVFVCVVCVRVVCVWCVCVVCVVGVGGCVCEGVCGICVVFVFFLIHLFTSLLHYWWVILHALFSILHTMLYLVYIHCITSIDCFCSVLRSNLYCLRILWILYGTVLLIYYSSLANFLTLSLLLLVFPFPSLGEGSQI